MILGDWKAVAATLLIELVFSHSLDCIIVIEGADDTMAHELSPHHIDLIYNAALASFWRRNALGKFLRGCGISDSFLASWAADESKRDLLDKLFTELRRAEKGNLALAKMSKFLQEQTSFPDLKGWEDAEHKISEASRAVEALRNFEFANQKNEAAEAEHRASRLRYEADQNAVRRSGQDLSKLDGRLRTLLSSLGTQQGGYDFQDWFFDFVDYFELPNRRPYVANGRQIDGSLTYEGFTYLLELKFTAGQCGAPDIDTFFKKVSSKADNTMGIFVSFSGYSSVAIQEASVPSSPLLLIDHGHIFAALTGMMRLPDILARIRRHASQTSEAFLAITKFDGR